MLIAQLSDIHAQAGASSLIALDRAMFWLGALHPDALIISGDISNKPHEEGYSLVKAALSGSAFPIFMVPGNVDDRVAMREAFPEADYWPAQGAMNFVKSFEAVRLIGFDVTVPGRDYGDALGSLGWLKEQLSSGSAVPSLIFMHQHAFKSGIAHSDSHMCRNADAFAAVLAEATAVVAAVTCGHGHRIMFSHIDGVPAMMCPSLRPANPLVLDGRAEPTIADPPALLLHNFGSDGLVSHIVSLGI